MATGTKKVRVYVYKQTHNLPIKVTSKGWVWGKLARTGESESISFVIPDVVTGDFFFKTISKDKNYIVKSLRVICRQRKASPIHTEAIITELIVNNPVETVDNL